MTPPLSSPLPRGQLSLTTLFSLMGSPRLTLVIIVLLAGGAILAARSSLDTTWILLIPLSLFAINLVAAILTRAIFRRQTALLVFHLALLAIVVLVATGRLTYLKGSVEVSVGQEFEGTLTNYTAGPLHPWGVRDLRFENLGIEVDFRPGRKRGTTQNKVRWLEPNGEVKQGIIGDVRPLVLSHYRFYTTPNNGFAPLFTWHPTDGSPPTRGTVHLPAYPLHEYRQARDWVLPDGSARLWIQLEFDDSLIDPTKVTRLEPPLQHRLIVRTDQSRHTLTPGAELQLAGGRLVYDGLTSWMGYGVSYDRTIHWVLAASLMSVLSLGWYFLGRQRTTSWLSNTSSQKG